MLLKFSDDYANIGRVTKSIELSKEALRIAQLIGEHSNRIRRIKWPLRSFQSRMSLC